MLTSFWVSEPLGKAKVDHIYIVLLLTDTNQKVVWFDISMQEMARMDKLNPLKHLISKHQDSFETEFSLAVI